MKQRTLSRSRFYRTREFGAVDVSFVEDDGGYHVKIFSDRFKWSYPQNFWNKDKAREAYESMCAAAELDALPGCLWTRNDEVTWS